jgi:catechol 2,3-dioxygenase-like lactoylglutathione lyase family enzyme
MSRLDQRNEGGWIMDFKLELVLVPVSDVDRAKEFYVEKCGFNLDVDHQPNEDFRVVQITPPGSACSLTIGIGLSDAAPGSYRGTHLIVTDIEAARAELVGRGVDVSEIRHMTPNGWEPGVDPEHGDYGSFADFKDPDGNSWVLQEVRRGKPAA